MCVWRAETCRPGLGSRRRAQARTQRNPGLDRPQRFTHQTKSCASRLNQLLLARATHWHCGATRLPAHVVPPKMLLPQQLPRAHPPLTRQPSIILAAAARQDGVAVAEALRLPAGTRRCAACAHAGHGTRCNIVPDSTALKRMLRGS